jgi:hypothetical protein
MQSHEEPSLGQKSQPEFSYGYHVVAFLDLLGQKKRLCKIEGILNVSQPELQVEKLQSVLKQTVGAIWAFRESFSSFFINYLEHQPSIHIPQEIEHYFHRMRGHSKLKLQSFSEERNSTMHRSLTVSAVF